MKTSVSLISRVRPNQRVLFQKLDQEAVLLHLESGIYFGLDRVGMDIWRMLPESDSLQQVAQSISTQYGVSDNQSQQDLIELIEQMLQHDLVTLG
jgi:Coenzyme PQQ synthesis protein D (PqqD)